MDPLRKSRGRQLDTVALVAALILVAAACNPIFGTESGPVRRGTLTTVNDEIYEYQGDDSTVTATMAPGATDSNIREVFWSTKNPYSADQQACTTWDTTALSAFLDQPGAKVLQPGMALRIAESANGQGIRAVTVTQNIWYYGIWIFNVHVWDSSNLEKPLTQITSFDLSSLVGTVSAGPNGTLLSTMPPPPWHVCARTLGDQFSFKLWTGANPEPAWDDSTHVFTTTLPSGWDYPGYAGTYIGHLHPGQWATFTNFTTGLTCLAPDVADTPQCQAPPTTTSSSTSLEGPPAP